MIHIPLAYTKKNRGFNVSKRIARMEFHVAKSVRDDIQCDKELFSLTGNVILADFKTVREFTQALNAKTNPITHPEAMIRAGDLNAMGLIDEILHYMTALYRESNAITLFDELLQHLEEKHGEAAIDALLVQFCTEFPPKDVYQGIQTPRAWLDRKSGDESHRALALEELMLLKLANLNPAFSPFLRLFDEKKLSKNPLYKTVCKDLEAFLANKPPFAPFDQNLWDLLRSPAIAVPDSLDGQLDYIRTHWGSLLGDFLMRILTGLDVIREEHKPSFFGPGPQKSYVYDDLQSEYENFSPDKDWMPKTVLIAKSTLVWLDQLSKKYGRPIDRLDLIPDEELDDLTRRGFTGLWLIGLWERSTASREIKQRCGNPEAAASAYSLHDYDIAGELGSWQSLENLKARCWFRGIRLGSDMVPNHTGIDSRWVVEHPDRFLQLSWPPFPTYSFNGPNLSHCEGIGIYLEDHYYSRTDAAVVFKRVDFNSGDTRYIYHGNDGTSMPWNDTAQIDFLNPEAREAVISTIVGVCKQFPIVRFDAAMTLAKKHIQRLWFPEPGHGGDIASRAEHGVPRDEFNRLMPNEFWREVVDRCAIEAPDTLLLAEAFWMMEGYFVRTLGMHRVYNSAFMNMLKMEENAKYRATIKNTIEFDPEILKRFVNFMNNPDEDTAVAQFGKGDKYFGVCTLMVTMPGLPMFGHGQVEGYEEKYGMEYRKAYHDEQPDSWLIDRHEREIFPLMKRRYLFSGSDNFRLYDLTSSDGNIHEHVFAYSNRSENERALVFYNNAFTEASGWIHTSSPTLLKQSADNKKLVQEDFLTALNVQSAPGEFILFYEMRAQLWYIRRRNSLENDGLYVSLSGYQSQVFLNWQALEDNEYGHWSRLCQELDGRGVENLNHAFEDLFLHDLHNAFSKLFSREFCAFVSGINTDSDSSTPVTEKRAAKTPIAKQLESFYPAFARLARTAHHFIEGAKGNWKAFPPALTHEGRPFIDSWKRFCLNTMETQNVLAEQAFSPGITQALALWPILAIMRDIAAGERPGQDGYTLFRHWHLDRKLTEIFISQGNSLEESWRIVRIMEAWLKLTEPLSSPKTLKTAFLSFLADDNTRDILGINLFDNTLWFNKERFMSCMEIGLFLYRTDCNEPSTDQKQSLDQSDTRTAVIKGAGSRTNKNQKKPEPDFHRSEPIILDLQQSPGIPEAPDKVDYNNRKKSSLSVEKKLVAALTASAYRLETLEEVLFPQKSTKKAVKKGTPRQ